MTPGHLVVLLLAAIGFCLVVKWAALAAFRLTGTDPGEFYERWMEGD